MIGWLLKYNIEQFLFSLSGSDTPGALYTILPEKKIERFSGQLMGSSHVYDLSVCLIFNSGRKFNRKFSKGGIDQFRVISFYMANFKKDFRIFCQKFLAFKKLYI